MLLRSKSFLNKLSVTIQEHEETPTYRKPFYIVTNLNRFMVTNLMSNPSALLGKVSLTTFIYLQIKISRLEANEMTILR